MPDHQTRDRQTTATDLPGDAVREGNGTYAPLHDGAAYAEIPDPSGRTEAIPVLLTIRERTVEDDIAEWVRTHGSVPAFAKPTLRDACERGKRTVPPELLDDR